jgi:hypothetical protein
MGCSASVDQTRVRSIVSEEEGAGHEPNAGATGWNWGGTGTDSQNSLSLPNSIANSKEEEEEGAVKWWVDEVAATDMGTLLPSGEGGGGGGGASGPKLSDNRSYELTGGGVIVRTSFGLIQIGIPPETIKDSMNMGGGIPQNFVILGTSTNRSGAEGGGGGVNRRWARGARGAGRVRERTMDRMGGRSGWCGGGVEVMWRGGRRLAGSWGGEGWCVTLSSNSLCPPPSPSHFPPTSLPPLCR